MKRRILAAILAAACALLSGCVPMSVDLQRADQPATLVVPTAEPQESVLGDTVAGSLYNVTIYYVSASGQRLLPQQRPLIVEEGESLVEKAILSLMESPSDSDMRAVIPEGTQLMSVERSGNVAVVDLSIDARSVETEQQLMWMRMALTQTLSGIDGIEQVQLLIGGKEDGLLGLPAGAQQVSEENLSAVWAQYTAEQELMSGGGQTQVERTAIIYYASRDGRYIVPVAREVSIAKDDFLTSLIEALQAEPESSCLRSPFPAEALALMEKPELVEDEDGSRLMKLTFGANLISVLDREDLDAWQLYAALTYTLTAFLPDLDGLIVSIGDGQLARTERDGEAIVFSDGRMSRADYPDAVGRLADIYLSGPADTLLRLERVLGQQEAVSPRALLRELFEGPAAWEQEAQHVMPEGVSIDDVLGIRIVDGDATVNLSANLYRCCQGFNAHEERNLVYAIVNTLTGIPDVSSVRFQLEGEPVDSLVSSIFLRGPLMRNPGLVSDPLEGSGSEGTAR